MLNRHAVFRVPRPSAFAAFASLTLLLSGAAGVAAQVPPSDNHVGKGRSAGVVLPIRVSTTDIGVWPDPGPPASYNDEEEIEPRVYSGASTAPTIVSDPATSGLTGSLQAKVLPVLLQSWAGLGPNSGGTPPDPTIAIGPNHVVMAINDDFAFFTKAGALLLQVDFNTWLKSNDTFFDPKCTFDFLAHRYLCVVLRKNNTTQQSWWTLIVSDDDNPAGGWFVYYLDATVNGSTPSGFWADYPYIGYDANAIYLSANMVNFPPSQKVQYAKLRILDKQQIYAGLGAGWFDIWNFESGPDGSGCEGRKDRSLAPAQHLATSTPTAYVLSTKACGGNLLTLRRLSNVLNWGAGPTMTTELIQVGAYTIPPKPKQPLLNGVSNTLTISGNYLIDKTVYRDGFLYASHTTGFTWSGDPGPRATLKLYSLQVTSNPTVIERESLFGKAGRDYFYPSVHPTAGRDMVVVFNRTQDIAGEFPSIRYTVWPLGGALLGSRNVKAGTGSYTNGSWGDYNAAQPDPSDPETIWVTAEYSLGGTLWGTWVGAVQVP